MLLQVSARYHDPFCYLHSRIRHEKLLNPDVILHYDPVQGDLAIWKWPVTTSNGTSIRITPDNLEEHRQTHYFKAPCCLCASTPSGDYYTECAIYILDAGRYLGEYVAGCAENRCDYLVTLDRLYSKRGLRVGIYNLRAVGAEVPPIINTPPLQSRGSDRQRRTVHRVTLASIPNYNPTARRLGTIVLRRLFQLDAWEGPGLPECQFRRMFAQCQCGLVMTQRVFRHHICVAHTPIIDLTSDLDTSPVTIIDLTADSDVE